MAHVFRLPGESPDRVDLPGAAALPFHLLPGEIAVPQFHLGRTLAKPLEIDVQRTRPIQRAQSTDAIPQSPENNRKLGPLGQPAG